MLLKADILIKDEGYWKQDEKTIKSITGKRFRTIYEILSEEVDLNLDNYNSDRHILISRVEILYEKAENKAMPLCFVLVNIIRYIKQLNILVWGDKTNPIKQLTFLSMFGIPSDVSGVTRIEAIDSDKCKVSQNSFVLEVSAFNFTNNTNRNVEHLTWNNYFDGIQVYNYSFVDLTCEDFYVACKKSIPKLICTVLW